MSHRSGGSDIAPCSARLYLPRSMRRSTMYVVVQHKISDPATFWSMAKETLSSMPEGLQLHQSLPNADGSQCVCLWSADSVESVQDFIESGVGHISSNDYYAVETQNALGLP